jgi:hypothetical protein
MVAILETVGTLVRSKQYKKELEMSASRASCISFVFALIISPFSFMIGWTVWSLEIGFVAALGTFAGFILLGGVALAFVKDMSWLTVSMPLIGAIVYLIAPDFLPFLPFDDAAAMLAGSLGSFALAIRKDPSLPRWLFIPLVASSIYVLFGAIIPGPIDELLFLLISTGGSGLIAHHNKRSSPTQPDYVDSPRITDQGSSGTTLLIESKSDGEE